MSLTAPGGKLPVQGLLHGSRQLTQLFSYGWLGVYAQQQTPLDLQGLPPALLQLLPCGVSGGSGGAQWHGCSSPSLALETSGACQQA